MKFRRRSFFIMVSIILSIIMVFNCSKKLSTKNNLPLLSTLFNNSPSTNSEKGELKITFHDAPPVTDMIKMINITVIETQIIDFYDKKTVISDQVHSFDLLQLTANNPVVLGHTKVGAGTYKQIRLILDPNSTVTLKDGTVHPLKVPSGEQTGIKINGIFTIPPEKLYTLDIDLDPTKSVHYTPGQGYMLKPVIKLTGLDVLAGDFYYNIGGFDREYIMDIKTDGTIHIKFAKYPNILFTGSYIFDGLKKTFDMKFQSITCQSCESWELSGISEIDPSSMNTIRLISTWGQEYIEFKLDDLTFRVNRIPAFDFSTTNSTKNIKIVTTFPDNELVSKYMVATLAPVNGRGDYYNYMAKINDNKTGTLEYSIPQSTFDSSVKDYYLFVSIVPDMSNTLFNADGQVISLTNIVSSKTTTISIDQNANSAINISY